MLTDKQKLAVQMIVFMGAVVAIMLGFVYFMLGREQIKDYAVQAEALSAKLEAKKKDLATINTQVNMGPELERQAELIRQFTRRLPSSPDAPGFLNSLVAILATTGIVQEEVKPAETVARPSYTEIPYKITAYGHYHALGQFLTLIEQNKDRFMRVRLLKIGINPKRPSMHPIDMEITTFMFNQ
jgi:Tfp pilus assembly protein PilO